jgi:RimJ/RimL family protein N-acetyltransferase
MISTLETPRLLLKPLELGDAAEIQILFPQWEIVKFLNHKVPWPYPPDGALHYCRDMAIPAMERGEAWLWTIRLKTAPEAMIGFISLNRSADENRGFWMDPKWQGQGLMSEASDRVTDYWFNELGFPILRVPKAIANEPSRRISIKQGMRVVATGERDYVGGRLPSETWEITVEEWRARKHNK